MQGAVQLTSLLKLSVESCSVQSYPIMLKKVVDDVIVCFMAGLRQTQR